ncbi:MAG: glutamate racemase [Anaerovoracaceae bacterium]|jgi:glutamate racemase
MDNRPIGFFDSGLGGLTCIPHLMERLPEEKIVYFGDTARTPYGSKAVSTIRTFSTQITDFLIKKNVKMVIIACNTVSATCLPQLRERYPDIPILGIIQPAAEKVARVCGGMNRIGIIGTKVTVTSHTYRELIRQLNPDLEIFEAPCPAFVPLIEEGIINSDIMDLTIRHYMSDFILENRLDTLVLGCTHYPLIRHHIERMYANLHIIDPSEEIVDNLEGVLSQKDMMAGPSDLENVFYASDLSDNFTGMIDRIFSNTAVKVKFKNLDVEEV